jgi:hypothetical protein
VLEHVRPLVRWGSINPMGGVVSIFTTHVLQLLKKEKKQNVI